MNTLSPSAPIPLLQEGPAAQELHMALVRHYADVLRLLTQRIAPVPAVSPPVEPASVEPESTPAVQAPPLDPSSDWESAVSLLARRDWHAETILHLWLQPSYVLGLHVLVGVGVNLQGNRRIVLVTECGPQDQACMEAVLDDLSLRGLHSGMLLTLPGNVALQSAVAHVWGTRVWVQRCLNTVMAEALSGLDPDEVLQFRHRLQQAWNDSDAAQAQTSLQTITKQLTKVNRSSGDVLGRALESTLTLQRTGELIRSDRGLRVLNSLNTLLLRAGRGISAIPVHQRGIRLCAALLEQEPKLRRVRHAAYLPQFMSALKAHPPTSSSIS